MNKKYNFYAEGGSLGNHGLKQGDQIIKTMSGGVQKVKTRSGDIVYVNLANGYRGAEPPLPFAKGGGVRKVGNREYSTGRNWTNDHRHVNKSEQHEVNYNRRNSLFFAGGGEIRRFDRQAQMDSKTREEILDVLSESDTPKVLTNYLYGLFDGYDYSETANFKKEVEFLKRKNPKLHQRVVDIYKKIDNYKFEKYEDNYATGGVTKNYINRSQLNTITIKKGDQKLTYKVSDVYNGAYKLEDGGNLEKTAFYVPKRNVVKVQLRDGRDVKVANGYWIKKGAKPIHTSKYDDGGEVEYGISKDDFENYKIQEVLKEIVDVDYDYDKKEKSKFIILAKPIQNNYKEKWYEPKVFIVTDKSIYSISNVSSKKWEEIKKDSFDNNLTYERYGYFKLMLSGGKTTFKEKATAIAKNFEGKKVEPKYQKEYGKVYDKAEAKEVGNKIAGSQKAKYDSKMSGGGNIAKKYNALSKEDKEELMREKVGIGRTPFSEYEKYSQLSSYHKEMVDKNLSTKKMATGGEVKLSDLKVESGMGAGKKTWEVSYPKIQGKGVYFQDQYTKEEAKEHWLENVASKYKFATGGTTKRGGSMVLAKQIRKEGESWASAMKRANEQIKNK
jgi:hypothetical protein